MGIFYLAKELFIKKNKIVQAVFYAGKPKRYFPFYEKYY
jgi:hypothetical protein